MTTTNDDRFRILLDRISRLTLDERSDVLFWLSGYRPEAVDAALEQLEVWRALGAPPAVCPVCNDTFTVAISGPDENGQYDVDDCVCQTIPDFDPEERRVS